MTTPPTPARKTTRPHSRVISTRPVTFTCLVCGQVITLELYPGPAPIVCDNCRPDYRRRKKADAQRDRRARRRIAKQP